MSHRYIRRHRRNKQVKSKIMVSFLALSMILFIFLASNSFSKKNSPELVYQPVVVNSGDTLWKLAETSGLDQDTRAVILMIKKYNFLPNGVIYPGQVIYIPTPTSQLAYR